MALAILFAFLATFGFGTASILARLGLQGLPTTVGTLVSVFTSFLFTAVLVLILQPREVLDLAPVAFLWFFLYGLITFPMARFFIYSAFNLAGVSRASPILAVSPIFATLVAMIVIGERPNLLVGVGILVTVMGMALILSERRPSAS